MRVAVLSESSADEAAVRILVDAILKTPTTPVSLEASIGLRRGWPGVREDLPAVLKHLHYHTEAEAVVIVVDSDLSVPHELAHPRPAPRELRCRFCELRDLCASVLGQLRPRPHQAAIRVAVGVAVPAIEARLLCATQSHISETTWRQVLAAQSARYTARSLKIELYGSHVPGLTHETKMMIQRATELSSNLDLLSQRFPDGFGPLMQALREA